MKILTCIKQIGDSSQVSQFDAHALEEAIRLKQEFVNQKNDQVSVDVVTIGTSESSQIIRRAFGLGADNGYHIVSKEREYTSSYETASMLAVFAKKKSYDLILTGIMSEDLMSGQTGPMLAEIIKLPCVTGVIKTNLKYDNSSIEIEQEMENGFRRCLEISLPAVLTIQTGINTPGYPTLSKMLAAGKKKINTIHESDLFSEHNEPVQARQTCVLIEEPQKTRDAKVLQGTVNEKARHLYKILHEKALL